MDYDPCLFLQPLLLPWPCLSASLFQAKQVTGYFPDTEILPTEEAMMFNNISEERKLCHIKYAQHSKKSLYFRNYKSGNRLVLGWVIMTLSIPRTVPISFIPRTLHILFSLPGVDILFDLFL